MVIFKWEFLSFSRLSLFSEKAKTSVDGLICVAQRISFHYKWKMPRDFPAADARRMDWKIYQCSQFDAKLIRSPFFSFHHWITDETTRKHNLTAYYVFSRSQSTPFEVWRVARCFCMCVSEKRAQALKYTRNTLYRNWDINKVVEFGQNW